MSRRQVDALLAESGEGLDAVDRAHLHEELGTLLTLVDDAPPAPSPELAALLGLPAPSDAEPVPAGDTDVAHAAIALHHVGAPGHGPGRRLTGPRGAVTGAVVLAAATVGATGLSAAANSLPAPLQRRVADLSRTYLPFEFPEPRGALDLPAPGAEPAPPSRTTVAHGATDGTTRQDARVPTPGRDRTFLRLAPTAVVGEPDDTGPTVTPGSRPASSGPPPAARPAATTRAPEGSDVASDADGPRGTAARPTRPARDAEAAGSAGSASDAPTGPRAGRPDPAPPSLAPAPPGPGRPGPPPSHGRPAEPAPVADEVGAQAGQGKGDQVSDDRGEAGQGGSGDAPSRQPRPRAVVDGAADPVVDRLEGVAGSLGHD